MKYEYPTPGEVLAMHQLLIDAFGGAPEIRDLGALEAALMRPQLGYYADIDEEAAALMESLANNHAFVDGNKRVAFFITDTFLRMNGYFIDCDNEEAYRYLMGLFDKGEFRFEQLHGWLSEKKRTL